MSNTVRINHAYASPGESALIHNKTCGPVRSTLS